MADDRIANGLGQVRTSKPLAGVRVLDLSRLAPGPYSTMLLADMGADIIVIGGGAGSLPIASLSRGKRFISLDLKSSEGREAFIGLVKQADVLLEGYRPGVMKRLELDYDTLHDLNPRLIYCSLTGYGQTGPLAQEAGHDLNYLAISGALGAFGPASQAPSFPLNLLADFAGGSLFATIGILSALYMRQQTNLGQYIDAAMVDGCISLMGMHYPDWGKPVLQDRGDGLVAGNAPYYRCYRCEDDRFIAVGALESRFFANLWAGLGYDSQAPNHLDRTTWAEMTESFTESFASKPRDEWVKLFAGRDACVTPVLDPLEALSHPHNIERHPGIACDMVPMVPTFSGVDSRLGSTDLQDDTKGVLQELGIWSEVLGPYAERSLAESVAGLKWPPL